MINVIPIYPQYVICWSYVSINQADGNGSPQNYSSAKSSADWANNNLKEHHWLEKYDPQKHKPFGCKKNART